MFVHFVRPSQDDGAAVATFSVVIAFSFLSFFRRQSDLLEMLPYSLVGRPAACFALLMSRLVNVRHGDTVAFGRIAASSAFCFDCLCI